MKVRSMALMLSLLLMCSGLAAADNISLANWYSSIWTGSGNVFSGSGNPGTGGDGTPYLGAPAPPWSITIGPAGGTLFVVDGGLKVDQFEIFDFGSSLGLTSNILQDFNAQCGDSITVCIAGGWSQGSFFLAPGAHELTIQLVQNPVEIGTLYFRVDRGGQAPVPEPGTMMLFGSGLVAVAGAVRRKLNA